MTFALAPIGALADVVLGKMLQPHRRNPTDELRPYVRAAHVQPRGVIDSTVEEKEMWFSAEERDWLDLRGGDVVVVEGGAGFGRAAHVDQPMEDWAFQNSIVRVRPLPGRSEGRFLTYALRAALDAGTIEIATSTATIPHFTAEKVGRFRVPAPSMAVQDRVGDYLDRETAEIDAMDADLDQLVQTLRERDAQQHQAAIDTAGHPEVGLALLAEVQLGKMLDQKKVIGEPTEYLRAANITKEGLVSLDDVKVMPMTSSERSKLDLRQGDTLMIEGGDAGRVAFLPEGLPGRAFQKTVLRIRPRSPRIEARYLYLALRQAYRSGRIGLDHSVSTIPHFTAEKAERLLVPLPPLEEQRRIVAELDEQTARIDDMIADAERLKGLLAERRSTLITDVVTGKKEVSA